MCNPTERFGHNYIQGICLDCGRSQRQIKKIPLPNLAKDILNRKKMSSDSGSQLATDCVDLLGGNFLFYRSVISKVGEQVVREWLSDSKMSKNKTSRFMWLWKDFWSKIIWTKV